MGPVLLLHHKQTQNLNLDLCCWTCISLDLIIVDAAIRQTDSKNGYGYSSR